VGEALIMTAIGLFVAIPAVFAFNFFSKINSATISKFDTFAHDLHDFFATGRASANCGARHPATNVSSHQDLDGARYGFQ
jgi:hypothetical protein